MERKSAVVMPGDGGSSNILSGARGRIASVIVGFLGRILKDRRKQLGWFALLTPVWFLVAWPAKLEIRAEAEIPQTLRVNKGERGKRGPEMAGIKLNSHNAAIFHVIPLKLLPPSKFSLTCSDRPGTVRIVEARLSNHLGMRLCQFGPGDLISSAKFETNPVDALAVLGRPGNSGVSSEKSASRSVAVRVPILRLAWLQFSAIAIAAIAAIAAAALPSQPAFIGSVVGLLGFLRYQKLSIIDPTNVQAFIAGDWGTHMLGWLHYRSAPLWHLPLGQVPNLGYPLGTSMIFTDSIPLLGLVLRPFSALLPTDFQYLGLWLLASFVLQGALGARIASIYLKSRVAITASAALFVLLPAFVMRNVHPALTAHWIILAVLYGALRGPRRTRWGLVVLVSMTALIQPYIWMFVLVLLFGVLVDDVRRGASSGVTAAAAFAWCLAVSAGLLALVGGFSSGFQTSTGGFGEASANVLALVASNGTSRLIGLNTPPTQGEGMAFLGLGVLSVLAIGLVLSIWDRRRCQPVRRFSANRWPLATGVAVVLLAVFALSDRVFVGSHEVLNISWLYDPIRPLAEKFRSSGRAVWPLMYMFVALAIGGLRMSLSRSTKRPELTATVVLAVCAGIQYADLTIQNRHEDVKKHFFDQSAPYFVDRLSDPRWTLIGTDHYQHMAVVPTTLYGCTGVKHEEGYNSGRIALLSLQAYRASLTFNSGYFSRLRVGVAECCETQNRAAFERLDAHTIYIFGDGHQPPPGSRCDTLNGITVCVSERNDDPFAQSLSR
jgi:hypothetical protein